MQYHAITLVLPFVWVPQFEIKKAENIVFISTKHHLRGKISRSRETDPNHSIFIIHCQLEPAELCACVKIGSIQSESRWISFFEILNFSRFPEPDADENSELLVLFLVLLWITTVLNLFLFFGPSERLWYRMNDVNKSKKI